MCSVHQRRSLKSCKSYFKKKRSFGIQKKKKKNRCAFHHCYLFLLRGLMSLMSQKRYLLTVEVSPFSYYLKRWKNFCSYDVFGQHLFTFSFHDPSYAYQPIPRPSPSPDSISSLPHYPCRNKPSS